MTDASRGEIGTSLLVRVFGVSARIVISRLARFTSRH
jgi:hypothetical protein